MERNVSLRFEMRLIVDVRVSLHTAITCAEE
jgi:hypothetical protein